MSEDTVQETDDFVMKNVEIPGLSQNSTQNLHDPPSFIQQLNLDEPIADAKSETNNSNVVTNPFTDNAQSDASHRRKLMLNIETYESLYRDVKSIKFPASAGNYQSGDNLERLTTEQLEKIVKLQRSVNAYEQASKSACALLIMGAGVIEQKIDNMKGLGTNIGMNKNPLNDAILEIIMENSENVDISSPYARLAMILGSTALLTYTANKKLGEIKQNSNVINKIANTARGAVTLTPENLSHNNPIKSHGSQILPENLGNPIILPQEDPIELIQIAHQNLNSNFGDDQRQATAESEPPKRPRGRPKGTFKYKRR